MTQEYHKPTKNDKSFVDIKVVILEVVNATNHTFNILKNRHVSLRPCAVFVCSTEKT